MKHLKKHPKQQRMEDMTFPLLKVDPNPKSLGFMVAVKKSLDEGTMPANKPIKKYKAGTEFVVAKKWMNSSDKPKDKVIWEGREYLRSISDPHHGRHVFMVLALIAALLFAVVVL